ncbi:hypothetical protein ES332_D05G366700v1 [Gossypium tomentosum]|uniref:Uncharacterized protein n=1 Tax=Gossypium tomentosum TaxID=34277 RepID=A0A5D2L4J1_GOSTO|nr:hypothetical protein ES332_D05G366700v1 [Gossypium tomentosum]
MELRRRRKRSGSGGAGGDGTRRTAVVGGGRVRRTWEQQGMARVCYEFLVCGLLLLGLGFFFIFLPLGLIWVVGLVWVLGPGQKLVCTTKLLMHNIRI